MYEDIASYIKSAVILEDVKLQQIEKFSL